jgi:hypothetical protein
LSQQTPSAQDKPAMHSEVLPHDSPLPLRPQLPFEHLLGLTQSLSEPHELIQVPVTLEQTYGAHVAAIPATQLPMPSHVLAGALLPVPEQMAGRQTVVRA